jgi:hypothetical protein
VRQVDQVEEVVLGAGVLAGVVDEPLSDDGLEALSDEVLALSPPLSPPLSLVAGAVVEDFPRLSFL